MKLRERKFLKMLYVTKAIIGLIFMMILRIWVGRWKHFNHFALYFDIVVSYLDYR